MIILLREKMIRYPLPARHT